MTAENYQKMAEWFLARPAALAALRRLARGLTALVYVSYTLLCLWALFWRRVALPSLILVPLLVFLTGSALRAWINAPRPYEVLDITPLMPKDTHGKSFPSRHVFCAAVISAAFGSVQPGLGVAMAMVTVCIAVTRVLAGVHWPRDVLAALLYGGALGAIGFAIL